MKKRSEEEIFMDDLYDLIFAVSKLRKSLILLRKAMETGEPFENMYLDIEMHSCANLIYDFTRRYIGQGGKIKLLKCSHQNNCSKIYKSINSS